MGIKDEGKKNVVPPTTQGKENVVNPNTAQEPIEIVKKGRGRPKKDPNAEPGADGKTYDFKGGLFLLSMGFKVEVVNRSVDNSRAISLVEKDDKSFLMWEREEEVALFADAVYSKREPWALMDAIKELLKLDQAK